MDTAGSRLRLVRVDKTLHKTEQNTSGTASAHMDTAGSKLRLVRVDKTLHKTEQTPVGLYTTSEDRGQADREKAQEALATKV